MQGRLQSFFLTYPSDPRSLPVHVCKLTSQHTTCTAYQLIWTWGECKENLMGPQLNTLKTRVTRELTEMFLSEVLCCIIINTILWCLPLGTIFIMYPHCIWHLVQGSFLHSSSISYSVFSSEAKQIITPPTLSLLVTYLCMHYVKYGTMGKDSIKCRTEA